MSVEEITQLAERLAHERSFARKIVATIGDSGWASPIPQAWQTAGFVQELLDLAFDEMEKEPSHSVRLGQLALTIATRIAPGTYPEPVQRQIEGSAWLQLARSHRNQSQYEPALRALDRAEARFGSSAALAHDLAIAVFQRAIIYSEMRRFDESLKILREVTPRLEEFDQRRVQHARMVEAMICTRTMQLERAKEIYEQLLETIKDDRRALQAVFNNIAGVKAQLGDTEGAMAALQESRVLCEELGLTTEVARTEWVLAKMLLVRQQWVHAADLFHRVREEFLSLGLPEEAGLAALDLVEVYVATDRIDAAIALTNSVIAEFTNARLNERATTALSYLRDLLPDASRAPRAVEHVRSYVVRLKEEPALLFLPLPQ